MRINIWIKEEEVLSGNITEYYTHLKSRDENYIQVSITRDEFIKLQERKTPKNDWGSSHWLKEQYNRNREAKDQIDDIDEMKGNSVIKEYLTLKGADFPLWWENRTIEEKQIITGYFGH